MIAALRTLVAFSAILSITAVALGTSLCGFVSTVKCPTCAETNPGNCYCGPYMTNFCKCLKAPGTLQGDQKIDCFVNDFYVVQTTPAFLCRLTTDLHPCAEISICIKPGEFSMNCSNPATGCPTSGGQCTWSAIDVTDQAIWEQTGDPCGE